jgi:hypothetical protein
MAISLTKEEFLDRFKDPIRQRILALALNEDMKSVFPMKLTTNSEQNSIIIASAIHEVVVKVLPRLMDIVYEENLDV